MDNWPNQLFLGENIICKEQDWTGEKGYIITLNSDKMSFSTLTKKMHDAKGF